jgi:hypothetical protein
MKYICGICLEPCYHTYYYNSILHVQHSHVEGRRCPVGIDVLYPGVLLTRYAFPNLLKYRGYLTVYEGLYI